jgi:hypothetical protein
MFRVDYIRSYQNGFKGRVVLDWNFGCTRIKKIFWIHKDKFHLKIGLGLIISKKLLVFIQDNVSTHV